MVSSSMGIKIKMNNAFCFFLFTFAFYINRIFKLIAKGNHIKFSIKNWLLFIYTYVQILYVQFAIVMYFEVCDALK